MAISLLKFLKGLVVQNDSDRSKELEISVSSSATTGTRTILQSAQTANRTLVLPDDSANLVGDDSTQTLTNKTIDADSNTITNIENADIKSGAAIDRAKLASGTANRVAVNDGSGVLSDAAAITAARALISDANGIPTHSSVTANDLSVLSGLSGETLVTLDNTQTLQNKTLDNTNTLNIKDSNLLIEDNADATKQARLELSGVTAGNVRVLTVPDSDITLVGTSNSQTLQNKTLDNSNVITVQDSNLTIQDNSDATKQLKLEVSGISTGTTRTLSAPDVSTTILGTDSAQVITNKDIDGGAASNTRRITVPKDTKANLDALTRKEGTIVFASDENKLYVDDGSQLVGTGGLDTVQVSIANNQVSAADITGFLVTSSNNKAFTAEYSIVRRYLGSASITENATFVSNSGTAANNIVYTSAIQSDGKIVIGGDFTSFNGTSINRVARLNADGTLDTAFNTNLGTASPGSIQKVYVQSDGKILVSGNFATFNGNTRAFLVRLNSDGTEDTSFYTNLGTGFNSFIVDIVEHSSGKLLMGGIFTSLNGNTRNRIIQLNSDGTEDSSFITNLGTGAANTVSALALQSDGKIVVGGNFVTFNGNSRIRLVRLNSDGTEDSAFYSNIGTGFDNAIEDVGIDSSGNIYVGGQYNNFNGNARLYVVKLDSTGTEDSAFYTAMGTSFNSSVEELEVTIDDQILVGGGFTSFNGNTTERLVRLNSDGTEDTAFSTVLGTGFDVTIRTISVDSNRNVIVGGQFTSFNGNTRNRVVMLSETITGSSELMEVGSFSGIYRPSSSSWSLINETFSGDDAGVVFSMSAAGQLKYTSSNLSGTLQESTAKFAIILL